MPRPLTLLFAAVTLCSVLSPLKLAAQDACGSAGTTAAMSACESTRLAKAQADLRATYAKLQSQLTPTARAKLSTAEAAWTRFRDANAAFNSQAAAGGTLAPLLYTTTQAEMTEARATELKKQLQ